MKFKMKNAFIFSAVLMLGLGAAACSNKKEDHSVKEEYVNEQGNLVEPYDIATNTEKKGPEAEYNEGVVLVKTFEDVDEESLKLDVRSVERIFPNSSWQKITLNSGSTVSAVKYLRDTGLFEKVDYDYIMSPSVEIDSIDVSTNTYADELAAIETMGIGNAWGYANHNHLGGANGGGSPDVVVAVIDTGVDYNHIDLRNNIWTNIGEIAGNGIDDDGNGYVDDVRGWDCVNEDNDPMDDNGHGTHVAGIIAAENNNIGSVGVAFNCKVMPIKAGTHSGTFTNGDIAQAVTYAYMNGASVINMSFGGSSISMAVEDALTDAYYQCVLVAAAGNEGMCSEPNCTYCKPNCQPFYPGSLPYTVGVMSCSNDGSSISGFSNYDHEPSHYNQFEYDCFACGEQIISTWPNNKYARLSGTSMASPAVAGIAALLRSAYPDRETYSNKFIHSQLTNTGHTNTITRIGNSLMIDKYHPLCDAYLALTSTPKPHIHSLYNYYIFDNEEFSPNNNGDGFINAGETIRLGVELKNRGGKASNITLSIDTYANGDPLLPDPNIEIVNDTIHFDDIGTYSTQDGGKIYDENGRVINMTNAFVLNIAQNTPNGYLFVINLHVEYYNGLEDDGIKYTGEVALSLYASNGMRLSGFITEDTVFTSDKRYIITDSLIIQADVTVTFEEGCEIVFFDLPSGYLGGILNSPRIDVYGTLLVRGTEDNLVTMKTNEYFDEYAYYIYPHGDNARVEIEYADIRNAVFEKDSQWCGQTVLNHCLISTDCPSTYHTRVRNGSFVLEGGDYSCLNEANNCFFNVSHSGGFKYRIHNSTNSMYVLGNDSVYGGPNNGLLQVFEMSARADGVFNNNLVVASKKRDSGTTPLLEINTKFYGYEGNHYVQNNAFITDFVVSDLRDVVSVFTGNLQTNYIFPSYSDDNFFCDIYQQYENVLITPNVNSSNERLIDTSNSVNHDDSNVWPYIKDISIIDSDSHVVHTVGTEQNTVRVTFSRALDTNKTFELYYGSWYPYADYKVKDGHYVSDTVWEGTMQVKANIEGGIQYFSSKGGCAKGDPFKTLYNNAGAFTFNIDTSSAFSMNLQANPTEEGVELSWVQDDYDTLMGYNIYRSDAKDGNYSRINSSIIPAGEHTFLDNSCEPGKTYWYTFTVVLSDFSESAPAGRVSATPIDTISPVIYHNPVNQGYENNNLVISCSASDNIAVTSVTLYYRTVGDTDWKTLTMTKDNDRYSATIFGSEVTQAGLEYYISATDGRNVITRGSADNPYQVLVKESSALSRLGDVDGDGAITTRDALMIMQHISGTIILTNDQFTRGDLNKNGVLSSSEALRILQYINGNVSTLEM